MGYSFSWVVTIVTTQLQLIPDRHISPSIYRSFRMFTPKVKQVFSSMCQHGVGSTKDWSLPLLVLHTFYRQRVLMAIQHVQVISILTCVVAIGEGSSKLDVISRGPPLSLFDMFLAIGRGSKTNVPLVVCLLS